jgi:hypothetical protein
MLFRLNDPSRRMYLVGAAIASEVLMRTQPADRNNPANPLSKVAALSLGTSDFKTGQIRQIRVIASLNFKKSDDLRGTVKSDDGRLITVCFSLKIRRSSFEIGVSFDGIERSSPRIMNVAFASPLQVKATTREVISIVRKSDEGYDIQGLGAAGVSPASIVSHARLGGKGKVESTKVAKKERRTSRDFVETNIAVTYGGNVIHWEINPKSDPTLPEGGQAFLQGEVFRSGSQGGLVDACIIAWKPSDQKGPLVVSGSVYVSMEDLILDSIKFRDECGDEVSWLRLGGRVVFSSLSRLMSKPKERIVKQIIRKHLISQGMGADGARVEICRAHS